MPSRTGAAVAAALLSTALLAGCASGSSTSSSSSSASSGSSATPSPSTTGTPVACAASGSASDAVKVAGSKAAPTVSFPTPTSVTATQRTVVTTGSGTPVEEGDSVEVAYTLLDGKNGKKLDSRGYGSTQPITLSVSSQTLPGIVQALVCTRVGERFASVIPASAAFGDQGSEQLGVGGGDSVVFVADVVGIVPQKADGKTKALPSGFPKVVLAANGQPTVSIPAAKAPTTLKIADSKVGTGETVKEGDSVTLQYQGVLWKNGKVFDQSWGKTGPTALTAKAGSVIPGFAQALIGQKVGSQVVAIIPPADGYGEKGTGDGTITGTDTLVFVIDILATAHAS